MNLVCIIFVYTLIVVLPVAVRSSQTAKYTLYITGMLEEPQNVIIGVLLPWVCGAVVNHLQIYSYLINWTALITSMYVQFVCPLFMWSKASKEASIYENNYKSSMQMILSLTIPGGTQDKVPLTFESEVDDGVPSIIAHSNSAKQRRSVESGHRHVA